MKNCFVILFSLMVMLPSISNAADSKQERNYIVKGNKLYNEKRFAEAEAMYKKALTVAPGSEVAKFNLASALIRQAGSTDANKDNTPLEDATRLLTELAENAMSAAVAEKAAYDLGNIAFNAQQYQQAIGHYKNTLRKNPDNDKARQNLRLAQKRLQEQQQNKDKNKDKQDNKDQNKEQQQQNQQQQQQQQQQPNKKDQDNKEQDKPQSQDKKDHQQQPPQPSSESISDDNAKKILKAMENEEAATRKKVEARKQKADNSRRRQVTRPW